MRILVCGGRNYTNKRKVYHVLQNLTGCYEDKPNVMPKTNTVIIHGCAHGADTLAEDWAVVNWVPVERYPANWGKYGKEAGYLRNKQMLENGKPDTVVAFSGRRGTAMMVKLAQDAGVRVIDLRDRRSLGYSLQLTDPNVEPQG